MFRLLVIVLLMLSPVSIFAQEESGQTLVIANSKAWKPFSFINAQGSPDGILIDYWREYSQVTGTQIEFLLLDWNDSIEAVKDGRADFHAGLLWSIDRDEILDFSQPIMTIDTQLFVSQKLLTTDVNYLLSGDHEFKLGVVEGGFEHTYAKNNYPHVNLVVFHNNAELIEGAFEGEIDAFVADLQVANFYLHTPKSNRQFTSVKHLYSGVLRPAVAESNDALLLQLAKGMVKITDEAKQKVFSRWMYIETVYPNFLVPILLAIAVIAIISYMIVLRMAVRSKTHELELANKELKYLSQTDQLTGLSNRYHFYNQFSDRVSKGGKVCVMLFDIDDFKSINDTYGHQVGDVVIRAVGEAVSYVTEEQHLIGRIGGEEFAVVATRLTVEQAEDLAEQLCESVRQLVIFEDNRRVSVSLGCAYYHQSSEEISLSDADHLMYQAKAMGKDQVVLKELYTQ